MSDDNVSGFNYYKPNGLKEFTLVPVNLKEGYISELSVNGSHLCLSTDYPSNEQDWLDSRIDIVMDRAKVEDVRERLTEWLEGRWGGVGLGSLPPAPVDGLSL